MRISASVWLRRMLSIRRRIVAASMSVKSNAANDKQATDRFRARQPARTASEGLRRAERFFAELIARHRSVLDAVSCWLLAVGSNGPSLSDIASQTGIANALCEGSQQPTANSQQPTANSQQLTANSHHVFIVPTRLLLRVHHERFGALNPPAGRRPSSSASPASTRPRRRPGRRRMYKRPGTRPQIAPGPGWRWCNAAMMPVRTYRRSRQVASSSIARWYSANSRSPSLTSGRSRLSAPRRNRSFSRIRRPRADDRLESATASSSKPRHLAGVRRQRRLAVGGAAARS